MSLFPSIDNAAIRFAILLPDEHDDYFVYYTNDVNTARQLLYDMEPRIRSVGRNASPNRPFIAMMTTNERLPIVNLVFIPIRNANDNPKSIAVVDESSLYEASKPDVLHNNLLLPVKYKFSIYKTDDVDRFIEKTNMFVEQLLTQTTER
jgi:hypothetical protein